MTEPSSGCPRPGLTDRRLESPGSRIVVPLSLPTACAVVAGARVAPRSQWRDRVGFTPTSSSAVDECSEADHTGETSVNPGCGGGQGTADEPTDRPDSVGHPEVTVATIHLRVPSPAPSCGLPADSGEQPSNVRADRSRATGPLGLAPGGVCRATPVARGAGGLLNHRFTLARTTGNGAPAAAGGLLSVALSRGSPRVGVAHHLALWSPDLPRRDIRGRTPRSPGRLVRAASLACRARHTLAAPRHVYVARVGLARHSGA